MKPIGPSETPSSSDISALIQQLSSRYVGERVQAQEELLQRGPEAVEALLNVIAREEARRRKQRRRTLYFGLAGVVVLLGLSWAILLCEIDFPINLLAIGSVWGIFGAFVLAILLEQALAANEWVVVADVLAQCDDIRAVGPLVQAMNRTHRGYPLNQALTAVAKSLMRLLSRLQSGDGELLNSEQRAGLYRLLKKGHPDRETDFLITIVEALNRIGDEGARQTVAILAAREATTPNELRLRSTAQECLGSLEELAQRARSGETLLRPSESPRAPEAVLLRPAQGTGEIEASLLLRPSTREE